MCLLYVAAKRAVKTRQWQCCKINGGQVKQYNQIVFCFDSVMNTVIVNAN